MKKLLFLVSALAFVLFPLGLAQAAEFRSSPEASLTITADEQPSDLYVAGENITINSPVKGDLAVAAGTVVINGNIGDSLFAAGGTINIRGNVGRHVRLAGGTVTFSGNIGGDLLVTGGTITIDKSSSINGSLYVGGGSVTIDGSVKGDVRIAGGSVTLSGSTGPFRSYGSDLTIAKTAVINGNLTYDATRPASIDDGATINGETKFVKTNNNDFSGFRNFIAFTSLLFLAGSILLGWLLIYLLPKRGQLIVERGLTNSAASIGYGLLIFIITPILGVMLLASLIGLPIAFLLFGLWLVLLATGSIFGKIILGSLIFRLFTKTKDYPVNLPVVAVGVVVGGLISLIPVIGFLASSLFFLIGLGAVTQMGASIFKSNSSSK